MARLYVVEGRLLKKRNSSKPRHWFVYQSYSHIDAASGVAADMNYQFGDVCSYRVRAYVPAPSHPKRERKEKTR